MSSPDNPHNTHSSPDMRSMRSRGVLWSSWLLGAASLAGVVAVALHFSEAQSLLQLSQQVQPGWFVLALALQAMTYMVQGQIYRRITRTGHARLSLMKACRLGLLKLFFDQALPTYGVSGAVAVSTAFERLGISRPVVIACFVISILSYMLAYVVAIAWALVILIVDGHASPLLITACTLFTVGSLAVVVGLALLQGHQPTRALHGITRYRWVKHSLDTLNEADAGLTRNPHLLTTTTLLDLSIFLLDATTLWALVLSMGAHADWSGVYAAFMLASLLRSIGITPGGLGVFEGGAVSALHWAGIALPVALSATLLFRGLSFWAPMLPGILVSRSALRERNSH
ncbi:lysylphosphatidylglycerol synthase transmembrane domain-containing protein [Pseudomonas defluvii]|uniref:lysylphosphatidylglycerol synthase transmembrane domain-containing protein n=1 Tax=Pseudomonas defluvii TaxID=1876757 RepID=UPI0008119D76|nr:lysylphosphatidylglycerol synthase transmembrane domain-containing protein [Pseudomonas defluvii]